jgi:hypothetical protein
VFDVTQFYGTGGLFGIFKYINTISIFTYFRDYQADSHPQKVSLGVGAYR